MTKKECTPALFSACLLTGKKECTPTLLLCTLQVDDLKMMGNWRDHILYRDCWRPFPFCIFYLLRLLPISIEDQKYCYFDKNCHVMHNKQFTLNNAHYMWPDGDGSRTGMWIYRNYKRHRSRQRLKVILQATPLTRRCGLRDGAPITSSMFLETGGRTYYMFGIVQVTHISSQCQRLVMVVTFWGS